jgi:hypothetical protein
METLSEITTEESARRERAARYERLSNEAYRLRHTVARLTSAPVDVNALDQILELCESVPASLTTTGFGFVPGGYVVRDVLRQVVSDGLNQARQKAAKVAADLTKAKANLAKTEAALQEFQ